MTAHKFHSATPCRWVDPKPRPTAARARDIHGPLQPMASEDIFEGLFTRLLRRVGR
jgi:hypothetical protein